MTTLLHEAYLSIVGKDGADSIVRLDLSVLNNVATVTATLLDNYDSHPGVNADDLQALGSVKVVATDIDGDQAEGTVSVSVSDDVPTVGVNAWNTAFACHDLVSFRVKGVAFAAALFNNW